ncbi:transposase [Neisseria meningitidis]|nr:transposase [Neisseria meningitidis]OOG98158.1 transposase [Neisseria meningitidis]
MFFFFSLSILICKNYSWLNLNQDKATKPQTVQIVRQGEATPYWFKFNPLYKPAAGNAV